MIVQKHATPISTISFVPFLFIFFHSPLFCFPSFLLFLPLSPFPLFFGSHKPVSIQHKDPSSDASSWSLLWRARPSGEPRAFRIPHPNAVVRAWGRHKVHNNILLLYIKLFLLSTWGRFFLDDVKKFILAALNGMLVLTIPKFRSAAYYSFDIAYSIEELLWYK